jgi:hypothetical protein
VAVQNPEAKDKKNGAIKYASTYLPLKSPEMCREWTPLMTQALLLTYRLLVTDKLILNIVPSAFQTSGTMSYVLGREMPKYFKAGILGRLL